MWQEQRGQRSVIHLHQQPQHLPALQVRLFEPQTLMDEANLHPDRFCICWEVLKLT